MIRRIQKPRRGVVLLAVLIVLVLLSLAAYQYNDLMMAEYKAADNYHKNAQARAFADSGIFYAAALLSNSDNMTNHLDNNPYDNDQAFQNIAVGGVDSRGIGGRFTLIAPANPDSGDSSVKELHGVSDESGKININAMMKTDPSGKQLHDMLLKLPNMTEEIANSIIYWADPKKTQRSGGAADDYYGGLIPPYRARGGPLDSIDELLLVRGVTPELLYGYDLNRNGVLDTDENDSGVLDRGWAAFLTIYSREQNLDSSGQPLVYINDSPLTGDLSALHGDIALAIGDEMANFIILGRQYGMAPIAGTDQKTDGTTKTTGATKTIGGGKTPNPKEGANTKKGDISSVTLDFTKKAQTRIGSLLDLVNVQVTVPGKTDKEPATVYASPLNDQAQLKDVLPKLFQFTTTSSDTEIPARINVNTAPREVLNCLPDLLDADVQAIISARPKFTGSSSSNEIFQTPVWLMTEVNPPMTLDLLKKLERTITTRTQVYRVQVMGEFENGQGPVARVEAVIDTNGGHPRILAYRDLTDLGRGGAR